MAAINKDRIDALASQGLSWDQAKAILNREGHSTGENARYLFNLEAQSLASIQSPEVQQAIKEGRTGDVKVGETKVHLQEGKVTGTTRGGIWKPLIAAGAAALGGAVLSGAIGPGIGGAQGSGFISQAVGDTANTVTGGGGGVFSGLSRFVAPIAGIGGQVGSSLIQSHANTEAAKLQDAAAQRAIDETKRQFDLQREDERPYRGAGYSSLNLLLPGSANYQPEPAPMTAPAPSGGTLANLSGTPPQTTPPQAALVSLRAPSGQVSQVPANQADHYLAKGAVRV